MPCLQLKLVARLFVLVVFFGGLVTEAGAATRVTLVNQTGYFLEKVKYVKKKGDTEKVVGLTSRLRQNARHTFTVKSSGSYLCYISLQKDKETVYAKGTAYKLENNADYELVLQEVVFGGGSAVSFIDQKEFDAIK
jgi:hypothetical protein